MALAVRFVAAEASSFSFSGPDVFKIDWNTRSLQSADLNGDNRHDLILINNDRAKIEILYQRDPTGNTPVPQQPVRPNRWDPILEDTSFTRTSFTTGGAVYALASGDLNSDGRVDIAYTGKSDPLTLRWQDTDGKWKESITFDDFEALPWRSTLKVVDINDDERQDLIVLGKTKLVIMIQNIDGTLKQPETLLHTEDNAYGLEVVDINQDNLKDFIYLVGTSERALRLRLQSPQGDFGPELGFPIEIASGAVYPGHLTASSAPNLVYVEARTHALKIVSLDPHNIDIENLDALQPYVYALGSSGARATARYALGDFDGDGRCDLAVSSGDQPEVLLYLRSNDGRFAKPLTFPSLSGISSMASGNFFGTDRQSLLVLSADETMLGITGLTTDGRLPFPKLIVPEGEPQVVSSADFDADGHDEIVLVEKIEKDYHLTLFTLQEPDDTEFQSNQSYLLEELKRTPSSIEIVDLNGDRLKDILILVPRAAALLYIQTEDGGFEPVAVNSAIRKSLLTDLSANRMGIVDIDSDGINELIFTYEGFARLLQLDPEGQLQILDQFNARSGKEAIQAPLFLNLNGTQDLVFYDPESGNLQFLKQDSNGIFRYQKSSEVGSIQLIEAHLFASDTDQSPQILFLGKDRFWLLPLKAEQGWTLTEVETYETDIKDVIYNDTALGDLNGDGRKDLLALDGTNHLVEILSHAPNDSWSSQMHFTVFDENFNYQGRRGSPLEPREIVVADFNNDGGDDFAFLVHDRVLIYYQD